MKKILLVDDHKIIRNGIRYYFDESQEYEIGGEASDGIEALEKLYSGKYHLVLTDISMPNMDGINLIKSIRKDFPDLKIIALTMHGEARIIKQVLKENVDGYVLKNSGEDELKEAINAVMSGKEYFDKEASRAIIEDLSKKPAKKERLVTEAKLSHREKEILRLITEEYSNQEIANELFISVRTVETHKRNLIEKTGAKNIAGLVMYAIESGLT